MIKKLASFVKQYKAQTILTPILMVFEVTMEVLIPFIMAKIIDNGINGDGGTMYIVKVGALMVGCAFVSLLSGGLGGRTCSVASVGFGANLRCAIFDKVQAFSFSNTDKYSTPSLITRLTTDVNNIQMAFMMLSRMIVRSPLMFIMAAIFAVNINPMLSLVFLAAVPIIAIALVVFGKVAMPLFTKMLRKYDDVNAGVQENLVGIRVVKSFVREEYETKKFHDASTALMKAQIKAERLLILGMPLMSLIIYGCIIAVLYLGGNFIIGGTMTVGELTSFLTYIMQILMSLLMLAMLLVMTVMSRASAARVVEVLDEKIDITDDDASEANVLADGGIVFENVSFSYKKDAASAVLSDINLTIHSGETVGIIGGTGSSKTSLVQLIPRLYDVTSGSVVVGGHDVRDYKLNILRDDVAMVLQKNVLFSGTIRDNLKWGNNDATDEEIWEACRVANAYDFVQGFPDKLDTDLGQGGVNVSGGQKQRLCIARALLKKPKIIILDDSTSAVDTATDKSIRAELKSKLDGMTTIIIAQRIASIMESDRIVVLDGGKIVAEGKHDDLLANCELYRDVYESQNNAEVENA